MKRNYNYTTISIKTDTFLIIKEVKRYLEKIEKRNITSEDAIVWLLKQTEFL